MNEQEQLESAGDEALAMARESNAIGEQKAGTDSNKQNSKPPPMK